MGAISMVAVQRAACAAVVILAACDDATGSNGGAELFFEQSPSSVVAGTPFDVIVRIASNAGGGPVSLSLSDGSPVSGSVSVMALAGRAAFRDLIATKQAEDVQLIARAGGELQASRPFDVIAGPPDPARSTFSPDSIVFRAGEPDALTFSFTDAFGNPLRNRTVTLASSLAGSTFEPKTGTTDADGNFATTFIASTGGAATLSATIGTTAITFPSHFAATQFCAPLALPIPGSVTGSLPHGVCDVNGRSAAVLSFTKSGGGGIAFTTNATFPSRVEVKTGLDETNVAVQPSGALPTAEWLLPNGEYLFRITTLANAGNFTVSATAVAANGGTTARFLAAPGSFAQSLALSDRDFGDNTMYDYFVLFSMRPCTITLRSQAFDAVLWIDDAIEQHSILVSDTFEPNSRDAQVMLEQCNNNGNPIGLLANSNPEPGGLPGLGAYTLTVEYGGLPAALRMSVPSHALTMPVMTPDLTTHRARKRTLSGGR